MYWIEAVKVLRESLMANTLNEGTRKPNHVDQTLKAKKKPNISFTHFGKKASSFGCVNGHVRYRCPSLQVQRHRS